MTATPDESETNRLIIRDAFDSWLQTTEGGGDGFVGAQHGETMQWNAQQRVAAMEQQGVMAEVLFPNGTPFNAGRLDYAPDPDETRQANMAFNRWVLDFCSAAVGRLHAQALVSFHDVEQAVRDIHWAVRTLIVVLGSVGLAVVWRLPTIAASHPRPQGPGPETAAEK